MDDITLAVTSDEKGSVDPGQTQLAMDRVSSLPKTGHMMVNPRKGSTMLVTSSRSPRAAEVGLTVNNTIIPKVETLKRVGVTIQSDLKWNYHAESIISKASSQKYLALKLKREEVGQQHLVKAYCTFIRLVLEYAVYVWHPGLANRSSSRAD